MFALFLLGPNILLCTPLSSTDKIYALRLLLCTDFHTHKAQMLYINFEQQIWRIVFSGKNRNGQLSWRECIRTGCRMQTLYGEPQLGRSDEGWEDDYSSLETGR
jgi:hypothetical protein